MNAANKCRLQRELQVEPDCAAQVVIIDGITAWKVYSEIWLIKISFD